MSFPRYAEYKDSGVEWLGEVPKHWDVVPFYGIAQERNESNKGMIENNLLSLSYGRIVRKDMSSNDGLLPESFETYQIVRMGDIVFRLTDLQNDKRSLRTAIVEEDGIITSAYLAANFFKGNKDFYKHLLRAYDLTKVFYSMGGGLRQSMKFIDVKRLPLLFPPISEQTQIAAFLDHETAKLDNLINQQKKLIDLLKEKRQAVISHAVTKGLNPNAPMKDSGVEWLGKVPEGWGVTKLKYIVCLIDGDRSSQYPSEQDVIDDGIPFLSSKDIIDYKFTKQNLKFISHIKYDALSRGKTQHLDLIITVRGTIGHVAIFDAHEIGYPTAFINAQMMIIRPTNISTKLLYRITESNYWQTQLQNSSYGTAQQQLSNNVLSSITVVVPPKDVSSTIMDFLDQETAKIDNLIQKAQKAIQLLQERRTALISAAVTGKIDVRNKSVL